MFRKILGTHPSLVRRGVAWLLIISMVIGLPGLIPQPALANEPAQEGGHVLDYEGEDFNVILSYDDDARLPRGAWLKVTEVKEGTAEYDDALADAADALEAGTEDISFARFFDITIFNRWGFKIEPKSQVQVSVSYPDGDQIPYGQENAVHFAKDGVEVLDAEVRDGVYAHEEDPDGAAFNFTQSSFSLTGTVIVNHEQRQLSEKMIYNQDKKFQLYSATSDYDLSPKNMIGKTFVIANMNGAGRNVAGALSARNGTVNGSEAGIQVDLLKQGTGGSLDAKDPNVQLTEWTFVAGETITYKGGNAYQYYIVSGEKYLNINQDSKNLGAHIPDPTVAITPQRIIVYRNTSANGLNDSYPGQVCLIRDSTALNWHNGIAAHNTVFGTYGDITDPGSNFSLFVNVD